MRKTTTFNVCITNEDKSVSNSTLMNVEKDLEVTREDFPPFILVGNERYERYFFSSAMKMVKYKPHPQNICADWTQHFNVHTLRR